MWNLLATVLTSEMGASLQQSRNEVNGPAVELIGLPPTLKSIFI